MNINEYMNEVADALDLAIHNDTLALCDVDCKFCELDKIIKIGESE